MRLFFLVLLILGIPFSVHALDPRAMLIVDFFSYDDESGQRSIENHLEAEFSRYYELKSKEEVEQAELKVAEKIETKFKNFKWVTIISKNCLINKGVKIGDGSFIVTGSTINNGTIIGNHCLINTSSSIDHDNLFEDYSSTGPGVITGGQVKVGNSAHIGIGSVVKQKISIGKNALIGAKSLVIKNCLIDTVYYGSPVKKIRTRNYNEKYL